MSLQWIIPLAIALCFRTSLVLSAGKAGTLQGSRCPFGKRPVQCVARPCSTAKCEAYPLATCVDNYCGGCFADFYDSHGNKVNCKCPKGTRPIFCRGKPPCPTAVCPAHPKALCRYYICGACRAEFVDKTGRVVNCQKPVCPSNKPPVNCKVSPCSVAHCEAYPDAICKNNYCGGCYAEFYDSHGNKLKCKCPRNAPPFFCRRPNPCPSSKCPAHPRAQCRYYVCGSCRAEFTDKNGNVLQCSKPPICPPDKPSVSCVVSPCRFAKCEAYPDAKCVDNCCGGCFAIFYDKLGNKLNCKCPTNKPAVHCKVNPCFTAFCRGKFALCRYYRCGSCTPEFINKNGKVVPCTTPICPPDKPPVNCLVSPCSITKCKAKPNARCKDNYCGGCNAEFYDRDGNRIKCKTGCPIQKPRWNCYVRSCRFAKCVARPGAICRDNYCGGCNAEFYDKKGNIINCQTGYPVDKPLVRCFARPCGVTKCKANPTAKCVDNYCRGCNAEFYDKKGNKINCQTGCPVDKPLVPCLVLVSPCSVTKCKANPTAKCVDNYCGRCNAEFYDKHGNRINCKTGCPVDKPLVHCFARPYGVTKCKANPTAKCVDNYCGGCNAEFYHKKGNRINCQTGCPVDKPLVRCFARPCSVTKCKANPLAQCRDNYCGGCHAEFYDKHGNRINKPPVNCKVRPCSVTKCKANPHARCKDNYCGGCNAGFYDKNGNRINCRTGCPVDKPLVRCFARPCSVNKCKANPNARCKDNYCGGCNAEFYDKKGNRINCQSGCPVNKPAGNCLVVPCRFAKCEAYPDARCVDNYCGGCNAEFYDRHGNRLKCKYPRKLRPVQYGNIQPCYFTRSPRFPRAPCRRRSCGWCTAEFYRNKGKKLHCLYGK